MALCTKINIYFISDIERIFASGSLNHDTFQQCGDVQIPAASFWSCAYFSNYPLEINANVDDEMLSTSRPATADNRGFSSGTIIILKLAPLASNSKAKLSSDNSVKPNISW